MTIEQLYDRAIRPLPPSERFRLATLILSEIPPQSVADVRDAWSEEDLGDVAAYSADRFAAEYPGGAALPRAGDAVVVDFPGATGIKRRPAVVLSSDAYHAARPDVILGLPGPCWDRQSGIGETTSGETGRRVGAASVQDEGRSRARIPFGRLLG